jgi:hypothetical protein
MRIFQEGDKGRAICHKCECVVGTTFVRRDVPFSDGNGLARGILVAVCNACDEVVSVPAQSTPAIKAARKPATHPIEAKLPSVFVDVLDLACFQLSTDATTEFRKRLLTFYIHKYATGDFIPMELPGILDKADKSFPHARGASSKRLSLKVSSHMASDMAKLIETTHMNKTSLLKSLVFKIKEDVVDNQGKKILPELKSLVFGC